VASVFTEVANWLSVICDIVAGLGCAYALGAAFVVGQFGRQPIGSATTYPPVTILKPLHGAEPELYGNLARLCAQDYPSPVQIVCGVADPGDPAIAIVRALMAAFPDSDVRLVVSPRQHGANRKVSNLINMLDEARHDVLVIADSDIVVGADYLKAIAASLGPGGVGIVTLLYGGIGATGLWSAFVAAAIDYDFLPNVLVGLKLGLAKPCFGSTIAMRRGTLGAVGGFAAVADYLADDYALGTLVRDAGLGVVIPAYTVMHLCTERSLRELFVHELRWARTIQAVDPAGYAGLVITHALPLALLGAVLGGIGAVSASVIVAALASRFALMLTVDRVLGRHRQPFWGGPLRDLISFAVFVASFFGNSVAWGGRHYEVRAAARIVDPDRFAP